MKKTAIFFNILIFLFILLSLINAEEDIKDYPSPFVQNGSIVGYVSSNEADRPSAIRILSSLGRRYYYYHMKDYLTDLYFSSEDRLPAKSNVYNGLKGRQLLQQNLPSIIIGGPCANEATAILMNSTMEWPACAKTFTPGKALIKSYDYNGTSFIVIAGYSNIGTQRAVELLSDYYNNNLSGKEIRIDVNLEKMVWEKNTSLKDNYCDTDEDCFLTLGCRCPYCKTFKLNDPEVLVLNKYLYKCELEFSCILCIDSIQTFTNPVCIKNMCSKSSERNFNNLSSFGYR